MSQRSVPIYQIDAFTANLFRGNPAAVCPLDEWLPDDVLQSIAAENNLSETAFFVPEGGDYRLRWFTPRYEVPLCGHATLATAYVLFHEMGYRGESIGFNTLSGRLEVRKEDLLLTLDFPLIPIREYTEPPDDLIAGIGLKPVDFFVTETDKNYYCVLPSENDVRNLRPDHSALERLHPYGVVVTAPGIEYDCVSRYFLPSYGIPEDPVTGSMHCALAPYWSQKKGFPAIRAFQASPRGGELFCTVRGDRVLISGFAVKYMEGNIHIPSEMKNGIV
jgi:PhzF family phenazine biosynthesis protein